ncbi:Hpt domain-containing protein [Pseudomonas sp. 5P_3.1_Bac2]|uniref:hybrid sensor histidine kinase/response regulator n=1 Tax=Pseudomonas sp. 5P_3.1_Bac2 TaxID=2971617 RepID=UPI0021C95EB8|nr:Hpt domain-containing protein [Pseudomonas sp. 5P_3.1_Bac2]
MGDRHDYVALEWVKGEIAETLKQARQALEAFVENPQDATRMRFCQTYVHQVLGTLQMVEFFGAALLAEEMEQLAGAMLEGRVSNQNEALEVLMQSILQLPAYLDRIQTARRDLPMVVLPLLNDLRAARGEKLLSETSLFSPDMSNRAAPLAPAAMQQLNNDELPALLRKLRQMLQMGLVGVLRNQDLPTHLGYLARVFARLDSLAKDSPLGQLWPIASAVVEGLADGSLANGSSIRTLLRQVDKELKRVLEQGAEGFNQAAPEELSKNLLFYVAKSAAQSPKVRALREQYRLDEALPDHHVIDEERARLAGPDRDAMHSVVTALCEELVRVKDSLDLFVRSDRVHLADLQALAGPLKQIADTLAVLGFSQPRRVIAEQLDVVNSLLKGQSEPSDALLMDIAGALLYVEATLTGMIGAHADATNEASHLPTTDVGQIHQLVIREARNGLEQAKDAIIEFIASQWNHEHLARVPDLLTQVRGGLAMIPLPRAAELLSACTRYIQEQLLARQAVPNWQHLDTLADAITSVEYYLERLAEDNSSQGDSILDVAEDSMALLGYPLAVQPFAEPEPEPEPELDASAVAVDEPLALGDSQELSAALPLADEPGLHSDSGEWLLDTAQSSSEVLEFDLDALPALDDVAAPASEHRADFASETNLELLDWDEVLGSDQVALEPLQQAEDELVLDDVFASQSPDFTQQDGSPSVSELNEFDLAELEFSEQELADLALPEVDLPSLPTAPQGAAEPAADLSLAAVLATPVAAINPPAQDVPPSLLPPPADEEPVDDELLEVFIEEAGEVQQTIAEYFPQWCADTANKEALTEIRRAFHTLKGSGRMVRALVLGELSWAVENLLNRVLDRSIEPGAEVQQVIAQVIAILPELVDEFAQKAQRQRDDVDQLAASAHALAKGQALPLAALPSAEAEAVEDAPAADDAEAIDPQLLEIFRNEAEMHLDTLVAFLADCAQQLPQTITDDLQRALHTLKGSASMAGIMPVAQIAAPLERLVKEFKANLLPMDLAEAELLSSAEQLFRQGLAQLDSQPLAELPGAGAFLERVQQLHDERLEQAAHNQPDAQGEKRDPQMISIFLAEGTDILFDAEALLSQWREQPNQRQELSSLLSELTTLGRGAEMAELPQIDELCEALLDLYGAVEEGSLAVSEQFFAEAEQAHEALISMMDQVAAGLQVSAAPQRVAALRELLGQALDPDSLGVISSVDGQSQAQVLDTATAELQQDLEALDEAHSIAEAEAEAGAELELAPLDSADEPAATGGDELETPALLELEPLSVDPEAQEWTDETAVPAAESNAIDLVEPTHAVLAPEPTLEPAALAESADSLRQPEAFVEQLSQTDVELSAPADALEPLSPADAATTAVPALTAAPVVSGLDQEMVDIFLEEAVDILDSSAQALERWSSDPENHAALSALQRDLHTLKGGARMAEIAPIGDLAHELESLYEGLHDRRYSHSPQLLELLQHSHDCLAQQLEQLQAGQSMTSPAELISQILRFRQNPGAKLALDAQATPAPNEPQAQAEVEPWVDDFDALISEPPSAAAAVELTPAAEPPPTAEPAPLAAAPSVVDERDSELVEIFLEEGFDIIDSAGAALQRWMQDVDNCLELESLQRDLHTLKGGARMAEIREIGDLAHELEFLYEGLGQGQLRAGSELFSLLERCHDSLAQMLEAVREQRAVPDGNGLIATIKGFRANPSEQLSVPTSVALRAAPEAADAEAEADILDIFLEEADDLLENMEQAIGRLESQSGADSAVDDLLRILHTLKGGARLAGQQRLGDLSHDLEQHLSDAQGQGAPWPQSLLLDVQSAFDALQQELDGLRQRLDASHWQSPAQEPQQALIAEAELAPLPQSNATAPAAGNKVELALPIVAASVAPVNETAAKVLPFVERAQHAAQEAASRRAPQELVKVPAELLEGLVNLAGETSIFRGRVEQQVSDFGFTLSEMEATIDRVRDQLRRLDTETQAQILSRIQADAERAGYEDFDPLEMDRHSQLQQLSRALFESASDLLDLKETLSARNRDAETLLLQQARVNSELQEGLMRTRMVPFDRLVPRLRRIVRQIASELDKQVEFIVGNAEGEMDRTVLERIVAPLEHMLRNAVDHGIEGPDARLAAGKPAQGTIRLSLGREGGDIVLTLADDGAGVRLDAVRRKAIERGLMDADAQLSDYEVMQFILEAGFSTAEKITQISGRGVGMDVVHSEVKQLGGSMSIDSQPNVGTTFTIRLPFTVSVNRALMVLSGEDLYAIPLNTIEGIVRVSPYELEAYYGPDAPRFEYAGQSYELRYLGDLLNNGQHPKLVGQSLPLPVILVRSKEHAVAVQVDSLAGSREIVVKSLGPQFAGVPGISGATILGDGRVVVILDLLATIRALHAHLQPQLHSRAVKSLSSTVEVEVERPTLVMVVDDSVTVRKVTSRLLERNGMNVMTAKDGVDAIAQLQERKPDVMLLDIEMPRMDGFEVATLVRHDEGLKDLPIIMITSRTGDKHRERAMGIGVNEYLGKPYQEALLLETIQHLVKPT